MKLNLLALLTAVAGLATACVNPEAKAQPSDLTVEVSGLHGYKGKVVLVLWPGQSEASKFPDPGKMQLRDEHDPDACTCPPAAPGQPTWLPMGPLMNPWRPPCFRCSLGVEGVCPQVGFGRPRKPGVNK